MWSSHQIRKEKCVCVIPSAIEKKNIDENREQEKKSLIGTREYKTHIHNSILFQTKSKKKHYAVCDPFAICTPHSSGTMETRKKWEKITTIGMVDFGFGSSIFRIHRQVEIHIQSKCDPINENAYYYI